MRTNSVGSSPKGAGKYEYRLYTSQVKVPVAGYLLKKAAVLSLSNYPDSESHEDTAIIADDSKGYEACDPLNEKAALFKNLVSVTNKRVQFSLMGDYGTECSFSVYTDGSTTILTERPASLTIQKNTLSGELFERLRPFLTYQGHVKAELMSRLSNEMLIFKSLLKLVEIYYSTDCDTEWLIDTIAHVMLRHPKTGREMLLVYLPGKVCTELALRDKEWPNTFIERIAELEKDPKGHARLSSEKERFPNAWEIINQIPKICPSVPLDFGENREFVEAILNKDPDAYIQLTGFFISTFILTKLQQFEPKLTPPVFHKTEGLGFQSVEGEFFAPANLKRGYYTVHTVLGTIYLQLWFWLNDIKTINRCKLCGKPVVTPSWLKGPEKEYCGNNCRKNYNKMNKRGMKYYGAA